MTRLRFEAITERADWQNAAQWARSVCGQEIQAGIPTWWIRKNDLRLGVLQRATLPVLGLALAPEPAGNVRDTVAILEALRQASELDGSQPLIITHEDSAMAELHDRLLKSAGDKVRVYAFSKEE